VCLTCHYMFWELCAILPLHVLKLIPKQASGPYPFAGGQNGPYANMVASCTPDTGSKTVSSVDSGVFQRSTKFQWRWKSYTNSNGVVQKCENLSGVCPINPFQKVLKIKKIFPLAGFKWLNDCAHFNLQLECSFS
jgi:hypothetical protein